MNATHKLLLGGADGSRWKPPVSGARRGDRAAGSRTGARRSAGAAPHPGKSHARGPQEPIKAGILAKLLTRPDDDDIREKLARGTDREAGPVATGAIETDASWVVLRRQTRRSMSSIASMGERLG